MADLLQDAGFIAAASAGPSTGAASAADSNQPLAARMRPQSLQQYVGQQHLLTKGRPLQQALAQQHLHSMILWGPPGCGKTTLARLLAKQSAAYCHEISAVLAGVKEIREVVAAAKIRRAAHGQATILFVDEVHRFNKGQQDAFLPHVEQGDIILLGATTENPSFQLQNALLSRCRVYVLQAHSEADLLVLLQQTLQDTLRGLGKLELQLEAELQQKIVRAADGDARQLLNNLEMIADFARLDAQGRYTLDSSQVSDLLRQTCRRFDHHGDDFYQQISALHKSVRGSDPDAALYWLARMLDGGCDPAYLARRILRIAYEDIGLADPRAARYALDAWQTYERLGAPEGELALAQAVVFLACAAKSNALYTAFSEAQADVEQYGSRPVPLRLRNASSKLQRDLGYAKDYRYAHAEPDALAAGERYFPDDMPDRTYYVPSERGLEAKIKAKLQAIAARHAAAK